MTRAQPALLVLALLLAALPAGASHGGPVDLAASGVRADEPAVEGQMARVRGWFEGGGDAGAFTARLRIDGVVVAERRYDGDGAHAPEVLSWHGLLAAGTHVARLELDVRDEVEEADESNNAAESAFVVVLPVALAVDVASVEPLPAPFPESRHVVTYDVCNAGPGDLTEGEVRIAWGSPTMRTVHAGPLPFLAAGACARASHAFGTTLAVGTFRVRVEVASRLQPFPEEDTATGSRLADPGVGVGYPATL